jgi:DNA-binding LytR/AlgR family response regulator
MRIHRSYIVALNKIDFIEEGVININGAAIPVADAYKAILNSRLNLL